MRDIQQDTPPSSLSSDTIKANDGGIYLDDVEEVQFNDDMDYDTDREENAELEPPEDHASMVFNKHAGSVFCCHLHPNGKLAVTGGEDDKAYVWSVESGELVMDCVGHQDSVIFTEFSFDGAYLATSDMIGLIKVWKCQLEEDQQTPWPVVFEYEAEDLNWGLWHFGTRVLICGSMSGHIYVFNIPSGDTKVLEGHFKRAECGKLFSDGVRLAAGYEDGTVKIWDLKSNSVLYQLPKAHDIRVTAIDTHCANNLVASISTDGRVIVSTSLNGKIVAEFQEEHDLESVAFAEDPQLGFLALGNLNGAVTIWDVARQMVRFHCARSDPEGVLGVTKMIWVKNQLVTGCLDGAVRVYDGLSGDTSLVLTGHRSEVLDMCYNDTKSLILTTSDDGTARIFKYEVNKDATE